MTGWIDGLGPDTLYDFQAVRRAYSYREPITGPWWKEWIWRLFPRLRPWRVVNVPEWRSEVVTGKATATITGLEPNTSYDIIGKPHDDRAVLGEPEEQP